MYTYDDHNNDRVLGNCFLSIHVGSNDSNGTEGKVKSQYMALQREKSVESVIVKYWLLYL